MACLFIFHKKRSYLGFGFEGRMWDLIVSVPDHCLSFYFVLSIVVLEWMNGWMNEWKGTCFYFLLVLGIFIQLFLCKQKIKGSK